MKALVFPEELIEQFERTSFCPHDAIRGRPETGTGWNVLRIAYDPGGESSYPETAMYYDYHTNGEVHQASRPFAEWPGSKDGQFVKAIIDWLQSMTQARESP